LRITLTSSEYREVREKVQLIETIVDGATQQLDIDRKRLSMALSAIRSIQSKYFPQVNYSLYYFKYGNKAGEQPLHRQNYPKWRKQRMLEAHPKITDFTNKDGSNEGV